MNRIHVLYIHVKFKVKQFIVSEIQNQILEI